MPRKSDVKPGTVVTCRVQVEGYYSGYGGQRVFAFVPGMRGVVADVVPKVNYTNKQLISAEPKKYDARYEFVVVDWPLPHDHQARDPQRRPRLPVLRQGEVPSPPRPHHKEGCGVPWICGWAKTFPSVHFPRITPPLPWKWPQVAS